MKGTFFIVFLFFLHFTPSGVLAQNPEIKFNTVEGNTGQILGTINAITQDPHGYMWFSGQGAHCLYRYDGIRMMKFGVDTMNGNSMSSKMLETVYADTNGKIWVGFFDGLDLYNPVTNFFTHYTHVTKDPGSLDSGMVSVVLRDHLGRLWIGTSSGLDLLDEKTGQFIHYKSDPHHPNTLSSNVIRSLYEDSNGAIWVGCGFEFASFPQYISKTDGGLNRMEKDGTFTRFLNDQKNPNSLINNKIRAIFEDSRGILWIGTSGDGLHTMDLKTGIITRHSFNPKHPEWLSRPAMKEGLTDPITFIREDANGAIWIGTYLSGINRYDTNTKTIMHYESSNGYLDKSCWSSYLSRDNVLWLSSTDQSNFLYRVEPLLHRLRNIPEKTVISNLMADQRGRIWAGNYGLQELDSNFHPAQQYGLNPDDSIDLTRTQLTRSIIDQGNELWMTSVYGVVVLNKKNKTLSYLKYKEGKDSVLKPLKGFFKAGIRSKDGLLWLGSLDGLIRYDPGNQMIKKYARAMKDSNTLDIKNIYSLVEDNSGNIWMGTVANSFTPNQGLVPGLTRFDRRKGIFSSYLKGLIIFCLYNDAEGIVWAGTNKGLYRFNQKENVFTPFFIPQSDDSGESVVGIIDDDLKNLWIVKESAILKLNKDKKNYFSYGKKYGVRARTLAQGGICKTTKGEILIGNNNGFYVLSPDEMTEVSKPLNIIITDFYINNRKIFSSEIKPAGTAMEDAPEIYLKYNQNNFSFYFAAIDYQAPESIVYYTMLENYDSTWRLAGGEKTAYYLNIPPGKYVFRIRAQNIDGIQVEKSIQLVISPPWWKTWPAYIFYALLFISFSYVVNQILRGRAIEAEKQRAQAKELAQAKEIEKAYGELKATQAKLIQSEKMASLGELTAGIAHEIQNPLNFVNNFSELNRELLQEMNIELDNNHLQEAKEIAKNIIENEAKINRHGKRADSIVKGMLQHSRKSTGMKEPVDINTLVDEYFLLSYHGLRAKEKSFNALIKTDFDQKLHPIHLVQQEIGRVLLNLYSNAFYSVFEKSKKNISDYQPQVSVSTKKLGDKVTITISDNGTGIPPDIRNKIFQPFFTTKPAGQGTGLGLSLSYDIIKGQGGTLELSESSVDGAEFIIEFPV